MSELVVLMNGRRAGWLRRAAGAVRFSYDPGYRSTQGATPLSLSMPLGDGDHSHSVVHPWISGLLPDNERVIDRWSREFRVGGDAFALLGTPIGEDCAGAVQLVRPEREEEVARRPGAVDWLTPGELAERLRALRDDTTAWLGADPAGRFSLAGAQAKTALLFDGDRWGRPSGAMATSHILKPAVEGFDDHDLNEHLCLASASLLGLPSAVTRVERIEDQSVLVVKRYDRVTTDDGLERVHQEDLCQATATPPGLKYESEGGPGAVEVVALLRAAMEPAAAASSVWRFIDALAWNWLIGGTDAHAKNYSLLLSGTQVRLAPLYDIASALPYGTDERRLRLAMRIGRYYAVHPGHDPWPRAARMWGVDPDRLRARVLELAAAAPDAFSRAAAEDGVAGLGSALPARLTDLVADRCARCRRAMGDGGT